MRLLNDKNNMLWAELLINQTKHGGRNTYAGYAFYCVYALPVVRDKISSDILDATGLAATRYGYDGGEFGAGEAVVEGGGLLSCGAYTCSGVYSEDTSMWAGTGPWTLAVSLTELTTYTLSTEIDVTVSIATGTAVIDGPASATQDNPDQFIVTTAGTVTLTSDTVNPKVMITNTAYKMPYVKTEGTAVSVPENYGTTDQGPRFQIRDTDAGEVMMPELLGALDGVADEEELAVNGGFDTDSGWSLSGEAEINNGSGRIYSSGGGYSALRQTAILEIGTKYEATFSIVENSSGILRVADNGTKFAYLTLVKNYVIRFIATGVSFVFERKSGATDIRIDNVSVKAVSPVQATIPYKWRPMFNAGDLGTTQNIVTANDESLTFLYYDDVNEMLKASDGTNTSEVACSPVADTEYLIEVSYNASGLQISVNGTAGTLVPFAGRITVGDYLSHGWEAEAPQYVKRMTAEEGE